MDGSDSSSNRQKDTLAVINGFYRGLIGESLLLMCSWGSFSALGNIGAPAAATVAQRRLKVLHFECTKTCAEETDRVWLSKYQFSLLLMHAALHASPQQCASDKDTHWS
jgi:hypothetical protein